MLVGCGGEVGRGGLVAVGGIGVLVAVGRRIVVGVAVGMRTSNSGISRACPAKILKL